MRRGPEFRGSRPSARRGPARSGHMSVRQRETCFITTRPPRASAAILPALALGGRASREAACSPALCPWVRCAPCCWSVLCRPPGTCPLSSSPDLPREPIALLPLFYVIIVAASFFYGYLRIYTSSVWPAFIAHSVHDVTWSIQAAFTLTSSPVLVNLYLVGDFRILILAGTVIGAIWVSRMLRSGMDEAQWRGRPRSHGGLQVATKGASPTYPRPRTGRHLRLGRRLEPDTRAGGGDGRLLYRFLLSFIHPRAWKGFSPKCVGLISYGMLATFAASMVYGGNG